MLTRRVLYRVRAAQRSLGLLQQCNISSSCSPSMPPVRAHAASAAVSRSRAMYATSRINGVSANTIWNRSFSSEASKKDSEAGATTSPKAEASSKLPLPTEGSSTAPTDAEVKQAAEPSSDSSSTTPPTKSPEVTASPQTSASTSAEAKSGEGEPLHPDHPPYSESDREDEELQRSYAGFWPRFHVFKDMLFMEPTQREAALKRIIRTTSKVYGASGVYAVPIKIHMDLEVASDNAINHMCPHVSLGIVSHPPCMLYTYTEPAVEEVRLRAGGVPAGRGGRLQGPRRRRGPQVSQQW